MLEIDGSYGEGGGQILRTAIALSVLTKKSIHIKKIRVNRSNPGIKPQHYAAIQIVKDMCDAETKGLEIGSSNLEFTPREIKGGNYKLDITTAGSITLVFQTIILSALKTKESLSVTLFGGSDVKWSPSWDYFQNVFLPIIKKTGLSVDTHLIKRGYYPRGGGEAAVTIHLCKKIKPLNLCREQIFSEVKGVVNISSLPDHISKRIKHSAIRTLLKKDLKSSIDVEKVDSISTGVGVTLWAESNDTVLGSTVLGGRGVPSEEVGKKVATILIKEIEYNASLDVYAFDQVLPYMVIARDQGSSCCFVRELSSHANTNIWLVKHFFDVDFKAVQKGKNIRIIID